MEVIIYPDAAGQGAASIARGTAKGTVPVAGAFQATISSGKANLVVDTYYGVKLGDATPYRMKLAALAGDLASFTE